MKFSTKAGSTSVSVPVFIQDSSSTTGAGLTGLVYNSAGLTAYYVLTRAASAAITLATLAAVTSAYSSGGFKEIDATNMPGWYRFDIPDAALASGRTVGIHLKGATNMAPLPLEIELTAWDNQDTVRGGLTALPNAIAEAAGGLFTRGTGAGQLSQSANGELGVATLAKTLTTYTGNTPQTGDAYARIGANGVSLSAIPDEAGVTTLLARLTATRAGYLDNLSAGAAALQSSLAALIATVGVAGAGLTAADDAVLAAIAALNNLAAGAAMTLTAGERNAVADAWTARNIAGGSSSGRTNKQAMAALRNKCEIVAGVLTVFDVDDTTPLYEANITTAAGNPISAVAPTT